jgi:hypothetical protein
MVPEWNPAAVNTGYFETPRDEVGLVIGGLE